MIETKRNGQKQNYLQKPGKDTMKTKNKCDRMTESKVLESYRTRIQEIGF